MNVFHLLEKLAWALSAIIAVWLLVDLLRTNRRYSEAVLMSSREGEIEDELAIERSIDMTEGSTP